MNVRTLIALTVFSLAVSQHVVSMAQPAMRRPLRNVGPQPVEHVSPLGSEIQRFLAERSQASLDRALRRAPPSIWFDTWDEDDPWFDADRQASPWWDEPCPEPCDPRPPAVGRGAVAVSLAEVDGYYEIEAAFADQHHRQKYRASGSREEIGQWLKTLPPRLRKAILRQMPELDDHAVVEGQEIPNDDAEPADDSHTDDDDSDESVMKSNDICNPEGEER